ncbi:MAG: chemotaxis protein CheA [Spirochaetae bacterium HGW-Spirochaetae-1]|jgi:two-component system chemotaxis sensor kinase CheA|nr:MAG: chemotaxis protein CheA [Spirochaetae bacterium HGW-Spirochaetae-1]
MGQTDILNVFMGEAREIITNLESDIVNLEENPRDETIINGVFRSFHTLKGSSGIVGLTGVYEFTHRVESLIDEVRSGKLSINDALIDVVLESIDWVKTEIFGSEEKKSDHDEKRIDLLNRITHILGKTAVKPQKKEQEQKSRQDMHHGLRYYHIKARFREDIFEFGIDPLILMEDLAGLGEVIARRVDKKKLPLFRDFDPEKCYLGWDIVLKSDQPIDKIKAVFLFVEDDNEIEIKDVTFDFYENEELDVTTDEIKIGEIMVKKGILTEDELEEVIAFQDDVNKKLGNIIVDKGYATEEQINDALKDQEKLKKKIETTTIRVDTLKLDNLMNLLGEIVIGQSSLMRIAEEMEEESGFKLKNALYALDRTTREFQGQIMSIRMIPIGPTFEQFKRFVRDSSHSLGKDIRLVIEGGETELDKTVIEKIGDPLKHMIRNSIDHGIESPREREAAGKSAQGTIVLKAYHQEGNVYIEIIDDGKGIYVDRVKEKAIAMGLVKPDDDLSREKILSFLFMPGFSTAEKVGDLSGRGVGMDVVRTNIEGLRGNVEIRSREGQGTTMRLKLPLTLAIIDGMLVNIGNYIYIIPLLSVVESIRPKQDGIKTVEGKGEVIQVRGEYVSLVRLYDIFKIESRCHDPWEGLVVIVESNTSRIGLLVDDLVGQQQIVIKSLDNFITASRAVSGAAILGDGRVALIIDIFGLIEELGNR